MRATMSAWLEPGGHDFFQEPFMHAQPTNELLAARDCADAMDSASVHEMRLLMASPALGWARPRNIVTRTSAQRLIATELVFARGGQRGCEVSNAACDRHVGCRGQSDG
jgi:hypothetical protein